jgi:hypothetical protein
MLATLLARQHSYTCSAEIISISMDALSILTDASGTTPSPGLAISIHLFVRRWRHARGLCLESAFIYPGVGNTLGGFALNRHSFTPDVGNTLGGFTSNRHSFTPVLATCSGVVPRINIHLPWHWKHTQELRLKSTFIYLGIGNTLGGCALH